MSTRLPISDSYGFWNTQIDRLGDEDPLEVIAATPDAMRKIVEGNDIALFHARPFAGKWNAAENIGHMIDVEWAFGFRIRTIRCDVNVKLEPMDQDRWVDVHRWGTASPQTMLAEFAALRHANLPEWRAFTPDDMKKSGRHVEAELDISLELYSKVLAGHDLCHLDQIGRCLDAAKN